MRSGSDSRVGHRVAGFPSLRRAGASACACLVFAFPLCAQNDKLSGPSTPSTDAPAAQLQANPDEVLIDLVVRDKKNRPVTNLTAADVVVRDGAKEAQFSDLHLVTLQSGAKSSIALLFDRMSPDSSRVARDVATRLIAMAPERSDIAVLGLDRGLRLLTDFTQDRMEDEKALDAVLGELPKQQLDDAEKQLLSLAQKGTLSSGGNASAEERTRAQLMLSALEESQRIVQDQHAPATLAGLLALSKEQQSLGGRKIIVFFSEGLRATSTTDTLAREVVEAANRAGVSIYTVDTNAVAAKSFDMLTMMYQPTNGPAPHIFSSVKPGPGLTINGSLPTGAFVNPDMARIGLMASSAPDAYSVSALERDRDQAKGNPLDFLAKGTGGFSIRGGEKERDALERLVSDLGSYYEAAYTPALKEYDGAFHSLDIQPLRMGLNIRSRAGYLALAPDVTGSLAAGPFEAPMLKALSNAATSSDLQFQEAILCMNYAGGRMNNEIVVQAPLSQIELREDANTKLFAGHVSILAQVRDKAGVVVERFTQDDVRKGALETVIAARADAITLQRHFAAEPGDYQLEAVVLDRNSGKAGAVRTKFTVPALGDGPWLSDVTMVRDTHALSHDGDGREPLQYNGMRVTPNLSYTVSVGAPHLSFFFKMRGEGDGVVSVDIERDGQSISHSAEDVKFAAGAQDHVNLATIDGARLTPGVYQALFTYRQGEKSFRRSVDFTVSGDPNANPAAAASEDEDDHAAYENENDASAGGPGSGLSHYVSVQGGSGIEPPAEFRSSLLSGARERALGYLDSLMNFKCIEVTDRFMDRKNNGKWIHRDKVAELVTYDNHEETRQVLEVNGDPKNTQPADLKGGRLEGEFGGVLQIVFDVVSKADFHWKERGKLDGNPVEVFSYRVEAKNSKFSVTALPETPVYVAFHGLAYIDAATRGVRRITMEAEGIPNKTPVHASAITIDYDYVSINDRDYLMPVHGEMRMQLGKRERILHQIEFRDYHRFGSEAHIVQQ